MNRFAPSLAVLATLLAGCAELQGIADSFKPTPGQLELGITGVKGHNATVRVTREGRVIQTFADDGSGFKTRLTLDPGTYKVEGGDVPTNPPKRASVRVSQATGNTSQPVSAEVSVESGQSVLVNVSYP